MKRPWLTACLIGTIAVIGALGVRNEAHIQLERGLSRFIATLPPGARFSYRSAGAAILSRGVMLHDVVLQDGTQTFRASMMELGHPQTTPDGGLSITKLLLRHPTFQSANVIVQADTITATHLVLPPDSSATGLLTDIDLAHVALASAQADRITFQNTRPVSPVMLRLTTLGADTLTISDYGPGATTSLSLGNVKAVVTVSLGKLSNGAPPFSSQYSAQTLSLTQPDLASIIEAVRQRKIAIRPIPGHASLHITAFQYADTKCTVRIDDMTSQQVVTANTSDVHGTLSGLHFRPSDHTRLPKIDGQHTTILTWNHMDIKTAKTAFTSRLTIPSLTTATLGLTFAPYRADTRSAASATALTSASLALQGDRLIDMAAHRLTHLPSTDPTFPAVWHRGVDTFTQKLISPDKRAQIADFLLSPAGRTLTLTITPAPPVTLQTLADAAKNSMALGLLLSSLNLASSVK